MVHVIDFDEELRNGFAAVAWSGLQEVKMAGGTTLQDVLQKTNGATFVHVVMVPYDKLEKGDYLDLKEKKWVALCPIGEDGRAITLGGGPSMFLQKMNAHAHFPDFGRL